MTTCPEPVALRARRGSSWTAIAVLLWCGCGDDKAPPNDMSGMPADGTTAGSGQAGNAAGTQGAAGTAAGAMAAGGVMSTGGAMATGGATAAGGSMPTGGAMATGGGTSAGGTMAGAGGSTQTGGTGAQAVACTRELLSSTVDAYFAALAANDPSSLPLAADVKFTENGEVLQLGEGLWQDAGELVYEHSALDTEQCMSVSSSVVPDGGTNIPVGLRLALVDGAITEIEMIVVRPGTYMLSGTTFASDPDAIIASASLGWEDAVPVAERATREELAAWVTRYFEMFPDGGCDLAQDCVRLENGGGSFPCSLGATCMTGGGGFGGPMDARLVVVDDVTGVGVGFTMFMGNTDMHMIMLRGGEVHAVQATLTGASQSGWD